jgi:hypothetical protein
MIAIAFGVLVFRLRFFTGVSKSSFYRVLWKTMHAINNTKESLLFIKFPVSIEEAEAAAQGFQRISTQGCIWNYVAAIDGYLQIETPSKKKEAKNVHFIQDTTKHMGSMSRLVVTTTVNSPSLVLQDQVFWETGKLYIRLGLVI